MMGCTCSKCGHDFDNYPRNCPDCGANREEFIPHVWGRPSLEEEIWSSSELEDHDSSDEVNF